MVTSKGLCMCILYVPGGAGKERSRSANDITVIGTRDKGRLPGEDDACDEPEPWLGKRRRAWVVRRAASHRQKEGTEEQQTGRTLWEVGMQWRGLLGTRGKGLEEAAKQLGLVLLALRSLRWFGEGSNEVRAGLWEDWPCLSVGRQLASQGLDIQVEVWDQP